MARSKLSENQAVDLDFASEAELTTTSGILHAYTTTVSGVLQTQHDNHVSIYDIHFPWQDVDDEITTVSGVLQEQFTEWRRLHLAATGDLGTGGKWADLGNIYDVPVVIFNKNRVEQMVMMFKVVGNMHPGENPQIVVSTASVDTAPQAGDAVRWLIEFTFIAYGESLGIPPDITVSGTQTLDDDPSYLAIETRNTDLIFPITGFDLGPRLDSLVFMKVTRLGTDSLDTFNGDIALSEIWLVYYGT